MKLFFYVGLPGQQFYYVKYLINSIAEIIMVPNSIPSFLHTLLLQKSFSPKKIEKKISIEK